MERNGTYQEVDRQQRCYVWDTLSNIELAPSKKSEHGGKKKDTKHCPLPRFQHVEGCHKEILVVEPRQLLPTVSQCHASNFSRAISVVSRCFPPTLCVSRCGMFSGDVWRLITGGTFQPITTGLPSFAEEKQEEEVTFQSNVTTTFQPILNIVFKNVKLQELMFKVNGNELIFIVVVNYHKASLI